MLRRKKSASNFVILFQQQGQSRTLVPINPYLMTHHRLPGSLLLPSFHGNTALLSKPSSSLRQRSISDGSRDAKSTGPHFQTAEREARGGGEDAGWAGEMQQDPPHSQAAADAAAVARQGPDVVRLSGTARRAGGARGGLRGSRVQEVRGEGDVPEPPRLQEAPVAGGGGVRVRQPGPAHHPL